MNTTFHPLLMNGGPGEHVIGTFYAFRQLPDAAVCRGKFITSRLVECMVKGPEDCPHVVAFGRGYFCWHPQRLEIASRTETETARTRV